MKLLNQGLSPFVKLMMTIAILMACFTFAVLVSVIIQLFNPEIQNSFSGMLVLQAVSSFLLFGLATGAYVLFFERDLFAVMPKPKSGLMLAVAVILPVVCIPTEDLLLQWNDTWHFAGEEVWRELQKASSDESDLLVSADSIPAFLATVFVMAVMPAVLEELFFRGILQRLFTSWFKNAFWAIILTSVIFSLFHGELFYFMPLAFASIVLGSLFFFSGNLWYSILAHFMNNFVSCLFDFLSNKGVIASQDSETYSQSPVLIALSLILIVLFFFFALRKHLRQRHLGTKELSE